ncbi:hypothetical protein ACH5RR_026253 [Cinchona calisaya]|uniref:Uncharacterized protein n=1 Tax=Cinchona calisaya TaxID=153742 RepID=A0ABD2Z3Z0_9GENT
MAYLSPRSKIQGSTRQPRSPSSTQTKEAPLPLSSLAADIHGHAVGRLEDKCRSDGGAAGDGCPRCLPPLHNRIPTRPPPCSAIGRFHLSSPCLKDPHQPRIDATALAVKKAVGTQTYSHTDVRVATMVITYRRRSNWTRGFGEAKVN